MKYLPLIWAGLSRRPARSILTLLSVVIGLLGGLLPALQAGRLPIAAALRST